MSVLLFSACVAPGAYHSRDYSEEAILKRAAASNPQLKRMMEMTQEERKAYFANLEIEMAALNAERERLYPNYPVIGTTYLSFSPDHGFQVTYFETDERSWLWYGGNPISLPAEWKLETEQRENGPLKKICWKYGGNTYNPSTRKSGGDFNCTALANPRNMLASSLEGDVFNLTTGTVPYSRKKCDAPEEFTLNAEASLFGQMMEDCVKEESSPFSNESE